MSNDKSEIAYRCIKSLVSSLNSCLKKTDQAKIKLAILDDHSDEKFLKRLDSILTEAQFEYSITHLETRGIMPSILACYEYGRDNGKDLVYFVQDDYLYFESAIWEMIDAYFMFTEKTKMPVCIYPYDDPYRYYTKTPPMVTVHLGSKRHWRTAFGTASPFMVDHPTLVKNFDLFDKMGNEPLSTVMEDVSLNVLFRERNCLLFTPIPSLALHSQSEIEKDPYLDWKPLWDQFAEDDSTKHDHLFKSDKKILLNIGAGKVALKHQAPYFISYKEVRVDLGDCGQDITSDISTLKGVPDKSVDVIYASHVVEHVFFHQLPDVFKNMLRVLKDNGCAVIRVPDIGSIAERIPDNLLGTIYTSTAGPVAAIDMIYGFRKDIASGNEGMAHKTGFTKESMSKILSDLGINAMINTGNDEVRCIIYKTTPPDFINDPDFSL